QEGIAGKDILVVKNEDCVLSEGGRGYLVFPDKHLVPGEITESEDYFEIALDTAGLSPVSDFYDVREPDRYRFLIACAGLQGLREIYSFSLDPENLMYDAAYTPKIRLRDGARPGEDCFAKEYKALIASVIEPRYTFSDYIEGGSDLYGKNKALSDISLLEDTEGVAGKLKDALSGLERKLARDSVLIDKRKYKIARVSTIVSICLFCVSAFLTAKTYVVDMPRKDAAIELYRLNTARDYTGVLSALAGTDISVLSKEERYVAAHAGAVVANLSEKQRGAVMQAITLNTDSLYLDYWIYMGMGEYTKALDTSRRISDFELELYALVIYRDAVGFDMEITGEEKTALLKELDGQISALEERVLELNEADAE
ncbi:MAG: hypothetical protein FWG03_09720, partial [Clostridiales bacterium]|nr:hypothetical protein [Clostridiales bacterium]